MIKRFFQLFAISILFVSATASADPQSEADIQAARIIGEKVAAWLADMPEKPGMVGIFQVKASTPLSTEYAQLVETEIVRAAKQHATLKVLSCLECRTPQVKVDGDNLVVSKGVPDLETLRAFGTRNGARAFLVLNLFRTKFSAYAEATLHRTDNAEIMALEQFRVPAFDLGRSSFLLGFEGGIGRILGPRSSDSYVPFSLAIEGLEELGFGKGGLVAGAIVAGPSGNLGFIIPTIALRTGFGATPMHSLTSIGAGFGMTGSKAGIALRGAYDLFIGSFTFVGIDATYLFPISGIIENGKSTLNGFVGLHIGVALGG